jgi:hypothetical protein
MDYVVGVDTPGDEHTLDLVEAPSGAVLAQRTVASNGRGYAQALRFAQQQADAARLWAVEGAGHYGAGLARYRSEHGGARGGPLAAGRAAATRQGRPARRRPGRPRCAQE